MPREPSTDPGTSNPIGLFARTNGGVPVQLNSPPAEQCGGGAPCESAETATPVYDGASPDERRVWFTTTQPLVDEDTDESNDLYMAELAPDGQLNRLVLASAGEARQTHAIPRRAPQDEVGEEGVDLGGGEINQGVIRTAPNGATVAFESPAVLTEEENEVHETATSGANNAYLYDANSEQIKFVTKLCSGPELSGTNKARAGPEIGRYRDICQCCTRSKVPDHDRKRYSSPPYHLSRGTMTLYGSLNSLYLRR